MEAGRTKGGVWAKHMCGFSQSCCQESGLYWSMKVIGFSLSWVHLSPFYIDCSILTAPRRYLGVPVSERTSPANSIWLLTVFTTMLSNRKKLSSPLCSFWDFRPLASAFLSEIRTKENRGPIPESSFSRILRFYLRRHGTTLDKGRLPCLSVF